jgi:hypothetical protein
LYGFGVSVWQAAGVDSQAMDDVTGVASRHSGYADPEYYSTGHIKSANDVYGLDVVMLEVLNKELPVVRVWDEAKQDVVAMTTGREYTFGSALVPDLCFLDVGGPLVLVSNTNTD